MHKWEKIKISSYGAEYKCINCGEFYQAFDDGESINLPPLAECPSRKNEESPQDKPNE